MSDRKQQRELQAARASGQVAPAVDVKTGNMINPHNPDFITKRPWYLGSGGDQDAGGGAGPSLDHQTDQRPLQEKVELSLEAADSLLEDQRREQKLLAAAGKFQAGQWVEALKKNKQPYRICQILKITKKGTRFDLRYEDGTIERQVKASVKTTSRPRIRRTQTGSRATVVDAVKHGKETYDSKRDSYHGYDKHSHNTKLAGKYEERDAMRKTLRDKAQANANANNQDNGGGDGAQEENIGGNHSDSDSDSDVGSDDSGDEFKERDEDARVIATRLARQGGVGGAQMKVTARNLRIREDTAKYLRNLDPSSAYYDPKSRSMRDNPHPETAAGESQYAGDNFARVSGDAVALADTQLFAWDATDQGVGEIHPQANPSQAEMLKKQFKSKEADLVFQRKKAVLDKYGGEEYLDGQDGLATGFGQDADKKSAGTALRDRKLRFGVSTAAEEYSRDGRMLAGSTAGAKREAITCKYEEDIFINGHTTVWGSFFHTGAFQWGFTDDHSLMKSSYCTGQNGRRANDEANEMRYGTGKAGTAALAQARGMLKALPGNERTRKSNANSTMANRSKLYGEANQNPDLDQAKLKEAMKKAEQGQNKQEAGDDRKRKYHSTKAEVDVTEEDMEAYRLQKGQKSDPMNNIGSDKLLDYE
jgi:pre-mRNA-processing factor SLU7